MKRIIALILSVLTIMSIMSCGIVNGEISSSDSEITDESKLDNTIGKDRIEYTPKHNSNKSKLFFGNQSIAVPVFTRYFHGYEAAVSMTFDDGYDSNTGFVVSELFAKYGFRGTAMLTVNAINKNPTRMTEWQEVFSLGYLDLGAHGYDHIDPLEITDAQVLEKETKGTVEYLRENFPTQRVLTFATPYATITDEYEDAIKELVLANRLQANGSNFIMGQDNDLYKIRSYIVNKSGIATVNRIIESSLNDGSWTIELLHRVKQDSQDAGDIQQDLFSEHCAALFEKYHNRIWFGSFEDVIIYAKQLEAVTYEYTAADKNSMTFKVNCPLDKEIYNIPMTMKFFLPAIIDSAYALVNGEYQELTIETDYSGLGKYVTVYDIPVDNCEVQIFVGGNRLCNNGCTHSYSVIEAVNPTHDSHGYKLYECSACKNQYYGKYTPRVHEYTGEREIIIEPQVTKKGYDRVTCAYCDKTIIEETLYEAPNDPNTTPQE